MYDVVVLAGWLAHCLLGWVNIHYTPIHPFVVLVCAPNNYPVYHGLLYSGITVAVVSLQSDLEWRGSS